MIPRHDNPGGTICHKAQMLWLRVLKHREAGDTEGEKTAYARYEKHVLNHGRDFSQLKQSKREGDR